MPTVLAFEAFHPTGDFDCIVWAEKSRCERWRFRIDRSIFETLGAMPTVVAQARVAICDANKEQLFAACVAAHDEHPDRDKKLRRVYVDLQPHNIQQAPSKTDSQAQ
jgi:hypothetical protein